MSMTCFQNSLIQLALESLPEYAAVRDRFLKDFENFVSFKKHEAVRRILLEEVASATVANCLDFQAAVIQHLDNEALLEKQSMVLSLSSKTLI
jgi:hypothetical protein